MNKLSFSIPSAKPESKHKCTNSNTQNDVTKQSITQFDPSKPQIPQITIPPIQNNWKPLKQQSATEYRRTPEERKLLHKLKLQKDLHRLPEAQGLEEFEDVPVEDFGSAVLGGYGWREGMGIGKKAKEDVKVVEFKGRTSREGLGFVPSTSNL